MCRDEVKLTRKIGSLRYFYSSAYFFSAIFVIVAAIVPHALSRGINLRRIFTTLSYCMVLRMTVTRQLPGSIQMWYDTMRLIWKIEVSPLLWLTLVVELMYIRYKLYSKSYVFVYIKRKILSESINDNAK